MDSRCAKQRVWPTSSVEPFDAGPSTPISEPDSTPSPNSSTHERTAPHAIADVWASQQPVQRVLITTPKPTVWPHFILVDLVPTSLGTNAQRLADGLPPAELAQVQSRQPREHLPASATVIMSAQHNLNQSDLHAGSARLEPDGPTQ